MVDTETARRRSSRHSSVDSGSVLPKQCIFCNADKYVSASKTREVLTSCVQLRADDKIRRLARERFDSDILAVTSNELIAKEAHYHFSCYRDYVRVRPSSNENLPGSCTDTEQACEHDEDDDDLTDLFQCLNDLYQNPKYITLKSLQLLVKTESGKKNIRRTIERKTNDFVFVNCGRNVHYRELAHLENDFPDIYREFEDGNFSVQLSPDNPFGRMEADKVIETTINKDTKTPGGTTGTYFKPLDDYGLNHYFL